MRTTRSACAETFSPQPKEPAQIQVGGVYVDTSTSDRIRAWQIVLGHWAQRPVFRKGVASIWWADAMYVKILAETGLIGLIAFLFLGKYRELALSAETYLTRSVYARVRADRNLRYGQE